MLKWNQERNRVPDLPLEKGEGLPLDLEALLDAGLLEGPPLVEEGFRVPHPGEEFQDPHHVVSFLDLRLDVTTPGRLHHGAECQGHHPAEGIQDHHREQFNHQAHLLILLQVNLLQELLVVGLNKLILKLN